ncbi:MAG TPA: hypothetical protein DCO79_11830 [Spirochaeta sp.]|nr:hypothetical protein [Spirochaeta sp.]
MVSKLDGKHRRHLTKIILKQVAAFTVDNIGACLLLNIGFIILSGLILFLMFTISESFFLFFLMLFPCCWLICWYLFAGSIFLKELGSLPAASFFDFVLSLRNSFKQSASFGGLLTLYMVILLTTVPFYISMNSTGGWMLLTLVLCCILISVSAVQLLMPMYTVRAGKFSSSLKDSIVIVFLEPLFIILCSINSLCILFLSILTAFLLPGITVFLLFWQSAYRILHLIYDADMSDAEISLFIENEEAKTPDNPIKGFISPWKNKNGS